MYYSTPGFPVPHYLPELAQTYVHWVSDAIQPSHPLSPFSCPQLPLVDTKLPYKSHFFPVSSNPLFKHCAQLYANTRLMKQNFLLYTECDILFLKSAYLTFS